MPQTLTSILMEHGMTRPLVSDMQLARVVEGSSQRRYNLVNRALKSGELHRLRRGLYLLSRPYRSYDCHPFALAHMLVPGSYVSLETALAYHGWIPEAVHVVASIVPGTKSNEFEDSLFGRFSFHPLATQQGHFLELVSRIVISQQAVLVAQPVRALLDLACLRKQEWQGIEWLEHGLRIDPELLRSVTAVQLQTLLMVYKQKRMQDFIVKLAHALGMELRHD
jgi:predicted transcriptional regulator of viral defense system